jgi:hypothetical protein
MLRRALQSMMKARATERPLRPISELPDENVWIVRGPENEYGDETPASMRSGSEGGQDETGLEFGQRHIFDDFSEGHALDADSLAGWLPLPTLLRERSLAFRPYSRTSDSRLAFREGGFRAANDRRAGGMMARKLHDTDRQSLRQRDLNRESVERAIRALERILFRRDD